MIDTSRELPQKWRETLVDRSKHTSLPSTGPFQIVATVPDPSTDPQPNQADPGSSVRSILESLCLREFESLHVSAAGVAPGFPPEWSLQSPVPVLRQSPEAVCEAESLLTDDHRIVLTCFNRPASFWHDIPLYPSTDLSTCGGLVRMLCLTPSGSRVRCHCDIHEPSTPLRLSRVNEGGANRFAAPAEWNLGVLPQTMSAPRHSQESQDLVQGDGQPVQIVEIGGDKPRKVGEAYLVKPFGALVVTDREKSVQTWTIVSVAADHRLVKRIRNTGDAKRLLPGMMEEISDWVRTGGCLYTGALERDIHPLPPVLTPAGIIAESHEVWEDLCGNLKAKNYSHSYDNQQWTPKICLHTDLPATSSADVAAPVKSPGGEHYDAVWVDMFPEVENMASASTPSPSTHRRVPFPPLLRIVSDSLTSSHFSSAGNARSPSPFPRPGRCSPLSPQPPPPPPPPPLLRAE